MKVVPKHKWPEDLIDWEFNCYTAKCKIQIPSGFDVSICPSPVRCIDCSNKKSMSPIFSYYDRYEVDCITFGKVLCTVKGTCDDRIVTRWRKLNAYKVL
jgi:ribosomal protein S27E